MSTLTSCITVASQPMRVTYRPDHIAGYTHVEFRSPRRPAQHIPVSLTCYPSHFAPPPRTRPASKGSNSRMRRTGLLHSARDDSGFFPSERRQRDVPRAPPRICYGSN